MKNVKGFTLIELLIVVAIIAILAAIAVPNFLEAQVRSKVSRAKSDLRSLGTAVEAYAVDWNKPPHATEETAGNPWYDPSGSGLYGKWITTPIAYITNNRLQDPFVPNLTTATPRDEHYYTYNNLQWPGEEWSSTFINFYGAYRSCSIGPDKNYWNVNTPYAYGTIPPGNNAQRPYDPTNGTVSIGNIWRSQKQPEVKSAPVGYFP